MSRVVGAYLCPRGVFLVESHARAAGLELARAIDEPGRPASAEAAATLLVQALDSAGIEKAEVAVVIRGFDTVHHVLSLPPASDAMLSPIIEREIRRLEPQLSDPLFGWLPLPADDSLPADQTNQRQVLVAATPRAAADAIESALENAGHTLLHLTALPAAFQRIVEEFEPSRETTAFVAPLPDGAFLGFFLGGAIRLTVEPPLQDQEAQESAAMAEEVELGAMFVRQQFRGAQIGHVTIAAAPHEFTDADAILGEKLGVPITRLNTHGLSASSLAAMGAVLDARSSDALSIAGRLSRKKQASARVVFQRAGHVAAAIGALLALWTIYQGFTARRAAADLRDAKRAVEQESFGLLPIRATAGQRRLIRDALAALRIVSEDREELQRLLGAISTGINPPVQLDSLQLARGSNGWVASLAGTAAAATNGRAVQALHDFYRDLPRRAVVEQLALETLTYDESNDDARGATVRFRLSFVLPSAKKN